MNELRSASESYWTNLSDRCDMLIQSLQSGEPCVGINNVRESVVQATQTYYNIQQAEIRKIYKRVKKSTAPIFTLTQSNKNILDQLIAEYCLYKNPVWYESFSSESGFHLFESQVAVLKQMHQLGQPETFLEWLSEIDKSDELMRKTLIISGNFLLIKKYFHLVQTQSISTLLLKEPEWNKELVWEGLGLVKKEGIEKILENKIEKSQLFEEKFLYSDYPDFIKPESPKNDPSFCMDEIPLFPIMDDDECEGVPAESRSFSSPRATSFIQLSSASHPRLYPYNQSRDWMIEQLVARTTPEIPKATTQEKRKVQQYFPSKSRLELGLEAGLLAWAKLTEWRNAAPQEGSTFIAAEIDLPVSSHSFIICPVSRQPCAVPQLLVCGHVISEESLARMVQAGRGRHLKCPVCPQEISHETTRVILM